MRPLFVLPLVAAVSVTLTGCDKLLPREPRNVMQTADKKAAAGDFKSAIKLYESSLDGTADSAEVHFKLAVLYADKVKSPLDALHHFDRYLDLAPNGSHAKEARDYKGEGQRRLVASLTKSTQITAEEAVRLKNENLSLRKALVELRAQKSATPVPAAKGGKAGEQRQKPVPAGARTHTVKSGETLASIASKYYKSKARWKDIQDANFYSLEGTATIRPGMVLIIPER